MCFFPFLKEALFSLSKGFQSQQQFGYTGSSFARESLKHLSLGFAESCIDGTRTTLFLQSTQECKQLSVVLSQLLKSFVERTIDAFGTFELSQEFGEAS